MRIGQFGGHVIGDHNHTQYIGAVEVDNFDVELSAITWSCAWLMQLKTPLDVAICYDSTSAAMIANTTWSKGRVKIAKCATTVTRLAASKHCVRWEHV